MSRTRVLGSIFTLVGGTAIMAILVFCLIGATIDYNSLRSFDYHLQGYVKKIVDGRLADTRLPVSGKTFRESPGRKDSDANPILRVVAAPQGQEDEMPRSGADSQDNKQAWGFYFLEFSFGSNAPKELSVDRFTCGGGTNVCGGLVDRRQYQCPVNEVTGKEILPADSQYAGCDPTAPVSTFGMALDRSEVPRYVVRYRCATTSTSAVENDWVENGAPCVRDTNKAPITAVEVEIARQPWLEIFLHWLRHKLWTYLPD